jgi:hypothetical protein
MSPQSKHRLYNDYVKGMNVRDICLKYGVLTERAYAMIWQKEYFYKVVYPRVGETTTRMCYEKELEYERQHGFLEYGVDLKLMGAHEQGTPHLSIGRTAIDKSPTKEIKESVEKSLGNIRTKKAIEVPIERIGTGPGGYLLAELVCRRGKNAIQPRKKIVEGVKKANKIRRMGYE